MKKVTDEQPGLVEDTNTLVYSVWCLSCVRQVVVWS